MDENSIDMDITNGYQPNTTNDARVAHKMDHPRTIMMRVEKRNVQRTGVASLGWRLGYGYVQEKITVKSDVWCVLSGNEIVAECRSKEKAEMVASAFNHGCT